MVKICNASHVEMPIWWILIFSNYQGQIKNKTLPFKCIILLDWQKILEIEWNIEKFQIDVEEWCICDLAVTCKYA